MSDDEIRVSWLLETGELAGPICHHASVFNDTVPTVGDVLAVKVGKDLDTVKVVERYHVQLSGDECWWHIIVHSVDIPSSRRAVLKQDGLETAPAASGILSRERREELAGKLASLKSLSTKRNPALPSRGKGKSTKCVLAPKSRRAKAKQTD
ncbi:MULTISPECIES: hypothetical protein [unclassified Rhizobium]|uniref:hypothetical protein n=1 Tax=unclassified Rhizobium TaxID=2613769 RepID=UPI0006F1D8CD|nr:MULTISPECIES: hypothetical protein [unclassified Rhizobium]KQV34443.1 hypothetical protein ASC86_16065 [Rhizobium sp. Root1212]KRD23821.1 hypothetical protein ASE37_16055 [Rhizobium sp. Root268]